MSIEQCFSCCFRIVCSNESRYDSIGTAFCISADTLITNAHIISYSDDGQKSLYPEIRIIPYGSDSEFFLRVEFVDFEKDYAVLKPIDSNLTFEHFLKIGSSSTLKIGDQLSTIGNLNDFGLCYNVGFLSSYKKIIQNDLSYNEYYQTNIEISKGNSGGPVLNKNNEVVGIMTLKLRDSNYEYIDGASFFIPIEVIYAH